MRRPTPTVSLDVDRTMNPATRIELIEFEAHWLDELIPIWRASFEAGVGVADPHSFAEQRQYFLGLVLPQNSVRLAVMDKLLVGFIAASAHSVAQLCVRAGHQRLGVGTCLLDWVKCQSSGSLWLYTFARNTAGRSFYRHHGFIEIANGFEPSWQLEDVKLQWVAAA